MILRTLAAAVAALALHSAAPAMADDFSDSARPRQCDDGSPCSSGSDDCYQQTTYNSNVRCTKMIRVFSCLCPESCTLAGYNSPNC
jgi:hypothetical protein